MRVASEEIFFLLCILAVLNWSWSWSYRPTFDLGLGGGAEFAGPENDGPQKNNDWKMQHLENDGPNPSPWKLQDLENDGPNRTPGICNTWKMRDQIAPLEFARPGK